MKSVKCIICKTTYNTSSVAKVDYRGAAMPLLIKRNIFAM